jgi:hypothetical protein
VVAVGVEGVGVASSHGGRRRHRVGRVVARALLAGEHPVAEPLGGVDVVGVAVSRRL